MMESSKFFFFGAQLFSQDVLLGLLVTELLVIVQQLQCMSGMVRLPIEGSPGITCQGRSSSRQENHSAFWVQWIMC